MRALIAGLIVTLIIIIVIIILLALSKNILVSIIDIPKNLKSASNNISISFLISGLILIFVVGLLIAAFYNVLSNKALLISSLIVLALMFMLIILTAISLSSINASVNDVGNLVTYLWSVIIASVLSMIVIIGILGYTMYPSIGGFRQKKSQTSYEIALPSWLE